MKVFILDWVANADGWKSGVIIRSQSHAVEHVVIQWSYSNGKEWGLPSILFHTIQPCSGIIFPVPANQNGSLTVIGPDAISVVASTSRGDTGGIFPAREARTLQEVIPNYPITDVKEWFSQPFWTFRPVNDARYTRALQQAVIQFAAMQVFYEYPDRNDRALGVYDASPLSGDPPGHPKNAHSAIHSLGVDTAYYTIGKNHTQNAGSEIIWSGTSLNSNFDTIRNVRFFSLIKKYLPASIIMVDRRIAYAPGMPAGLLQADDPELFFHHLHAHIHTGDVINFWALI